MVLPPLLSGDKICVSCKTPVNAFILVTDRVEVIKLPFCKMSCLIDWIAVIKQTDWEKACSNRSDEGLVGIKIDLSKDGVPLTDTVILETK